MIFSMYAAHSLPLLTFMFGLHFATTQKSQSFIIILVVFCCLFVLLLLDSVVKYYHSLLLLLICYTINVNIMKAKQTPPNGRRMKKLHTY